MCGIAALLQCPSAPELPPWPFWRGTNESCHQDVDNPLLSPDDVLEQLGRRGPDAAAQETITLGSDCTIHFIQTILSHRGSPISSLCNHSRNVLLFNGELYDGIPLDDRGDRDAIHILLEQASSQKNGLDKFVLEKLDGIRGPWTFVFWHSKARRLYFARDRLGRRSLLIRAVENCGLELLSVPPQGRSGGFVEVPTIGLAYFEIGLDGECSFGLIPRTKNAVLPARVEGRQDNAVVSGSQRHMYVSFLPSQWLRSLSTGMTELDMDQLSSAVEFLRLFRQSVTRRLVTERKAMPSGTRYAVLFSGGIDSLVIATVLDECLGADETIQLINVAFGEDEPSTQKCPDRRTAISGLAELQRVSHSKRPYDLRCVDVNPQEADAILFRRVRYLLYPCDQQMDASIGTAIWAAASEGAFDSRMDSTAPVVNCSCDNRDANARILFSGLGADELMGGYKGRHRTIFRNEGLQGIQREMDADLSRLWFRNLGRDDRLIADHGKEVRHPYLDEDLIAFVTSLSLTEHVCDLSQPDGVGDKHLLRRAARLLGFSEEFVSRSKRAIQFGSRSKHVIERKRR